MDGIEEYGYVYAIGYDGEIKIGISASDPGRRLTQMQSGNSRLLELVGATYVQGYKQVERILHRDLKSQERWIRGEWYRLSVLEAREVISGVGEDMVLQERQRKTAEVAAEAKKFRDWVGLA